MGPVIERVVVLGTGTEVGKTWVSSALAHAARQRELPVIALKPIETGVSTADMADTDAAVLASASEGFVEWCYRFPDPITPWIAAERCHQTIDLRRVLDWVQSLERPLSDTTSDVMSLSLVETAGGVFSPITETASNLDLARCLAPCRSLLVAPNRLGVLHDVVATVEAMRARGRAPDLLVLNRLAPGDPSSSSNAETLRRLRLGCPLVEVAVQDAAAGGRLLDELSQLVAS